MVKKKPLKCSLYDGSHLNEMYCISYMKITTVANLQWLIEKLIWDEIIIENYHSMPLDE